MRCSPRASSCRARPRAEGIMRGFVFRTVTVVLAILPLLPVLSGPAASETPTGTLTWGVHVTLATRWLDPSDTEAFITPFMVLYAIHDALVNPIVWSPAKSR